MEKTNREIAEEAVKEGYFDQTEQTKDDLLKCVINRVVEALDLKDKEKDEAVKRTEKKMAEAIGEPIPFKEVQEAKTLKDRVILICGLNYEPDIRDTLVFVRHQSGLKMVNELMAEFEKEKTKAVKAERSRCLDLALGHREAGRVQGTGQEADYDGI